MLYGETMNVKNEDTQNVVVMARKKKSPLLPQLLTVVLGGLVIASLVIAVISGIYRKNYADRIYPGVSVGGVDLSGLTMGQAVVELNSKLTYGKLGQLQLSNGENEWAYRPEDLGFSFNPIEAANQAFAIGHSKKGLANLSEQFRAISSGVEITPAIVYDQAKAYQLVQQIATQTDIALIEPSVSIENAHVELIKGQAGKKVDVLATLRKIEPFLLLQENGKVYLEIKEQVPITVNADQTANLAQQILSEPFTIHASDINSGQEPWIIQPQDLASLLVFEEKGEAEGRTIQLSLNRPALEVYISNISPALQVDPVNARMIFNDDTRQLEVMANAQTGGSVDLAKSVDAIIEKLENGEHEATLVMKTVEPTIKDDSLAADLGITELIHEETSYYYGSDAARVQNIRAGAAAFHGIFVGPGEVFSMAEYLTDISLDNGFAEAPIIVGDQTVDGVGGGICQVSTTVFRAAFFAGFPIVERHAHAYRVGYYEQQSNGWIDNALAGLDATVYMPLVDFKFRNDTPYWLLMETYPTDTSLTWKFYSTSDGREVDWWTTGITNIQEPPDPVYREDPTMAAGTVKQVDWAVMGADVEVNRVVTVNGETRPDTIRTWYVAWPAKYTYGPGYDVP